MSSQKEQVSFAPNLRIGDYLPKNFAHSEFRPPKQRILFMGGCHSRGYMVPYDLSFSAIATKIVADFLIDHEVLIQPYVLIHQYEKIVDQIKDFQPDSVVFQIGNFELMPRSSLSQAIKQKYGTKTTKAKQADALQSVDPGVAGGVQTTKKRRDWELGADPISLYKSKNKWEKFKEWVHMLRHVSLVKSTGISLIDKEDIEEKMNELFKQVKENGVKHVIVLSPLPSSHATTHWYRKQCSPIYEKLSNKYGFHFIDLYKYISTKEDHFLDGLHMSQRGHEIIGYLVGISLRNLALAGRVS